MKTQAKSTIEPVDNVNGTIPSRLFSLANGIGNPKVAFRYVVTFNDRHGRQRNYFRHPCSPRVALPGGYGSEAFVEAYNEAMAAAVARGGSGVPVRKDEASKFYDMPESGVYFLIRADEVVYIGTSKDMRRRVAGHARNGRPFDKAFYMQASEKERFLLEKAIIKALQPSDNKKHTASGLSRALLSAVAIRPVS